MKKLEKLTLKELESATTVIEDQRSVVAGSSDTSGAGGGPDISRFYNTGMLTDPTVAAFCSAPTGSSANPGAIATATQTSTFCGYTSSGSCNWAEITANALISKIPIWGDYLGIIQDKVTCERAEMITGLLQHNVTCNDTIFTELVAANGLNIYYNVYNYRGEFIMTTK